MLSLSDIIPDLTLYISFQSVQMRLRDERSSIWHNRRRLLMLKMNPEGQEGYEGQEGQEG